jgi:glycosyltransferase involved in cell wall biosynthesis
MTAGGGKELTPARAGDRHAGEDRRPRVLHVITHLDMGGAETVALDLIDRLRDRADFALFAVMGSERRSAVGQDMAARLDRWRVPHITGTSRGFKSGGVVLAARALARTVTDVRPDVIHVHTEIPELTLAVATLLSRRVRRMPLLRTVHNCELWIDWGMIGRWVTARLDYGTAVAVSRNAARADAAIAVRRPRVADVIYNGVARPAPAEQRASGDNRSAKVLFAGRLHQQKGADLLPAILADARTRTPRADVAVTIAGTGVLRDRVAAAAAADEAAWDVRLVDPIPNLAERLGDYDAVLLPSRFEGFGLLAAEALLAGVPAITTDAPGLDEVVPADYPFRAAVDDVPALAALLAQVIDDPAAAWRRVAPFRDVIAARFSPDTMASAYLARYRALAESGASNGAGGRAGGGAA